jgi:hypothetical protein
MFPARDVRIANPLLADRENLLGLVEIDAPAACVLAIEQPMLVAPLGLEVEAPERKPEAFIG